MSRTASGVVWNAAGSVVSRVRVSSGVSWSSWCTAVAAVSRAGSNGTADSGFPPRPSTTRFQCGDSVRRWSAAARRARVQPRNDVPLPAVLGLSAPEDTAA